MQKSSRMLQLNKLNTCIHLDREVKALVKEANDLYLDEVEGTQSILYDLDQEGFPQLKHLEIKNSHDIQFVINSTKQVSCDAFPSLESLSMWNLMKLENAFQGQLTTISFSKLRILGVGNCNSLKTLFPISIIRNFSQLQELSVTYCNNLEAIVAHENGVGDDKIEVAEFIQLRSLELRRLPLLKSFCSKVKTLPILQAEQGQLTEPDSPLAFFDRTVCLCLALLLLLLLLKFFADLLSVSCDMIPSSPNIKKKKVIL